MTFNDLSRPQMTSDLKNQNVKVKCIITTKTGNILKQAELRCGTQHLAPMPLAMTQVMCFLPTNMRGKHFKQGRFNTYTGVKRG